MLKQYDASSPTLMPRLTYNLRVSPSAGGAPLRTALLRHNAESTYVVPGDWPQADGETWFHNAKAPPAGSGVQYLIDGAKAFEAMIEAMETATKPGHYIIILGWSLDVTFAFARKKTFLQVAQERAKLGVAIRVLLWHNVLYAVNERSKQLLNRLHTTNNNLDVYCTLDANTKGLSSTTIAGWAGKKGVHNYGAHHHKIQLVYGDEGLVAFCGGIDLDANRLAYLHDVHVRVVGDGAKDLLQIAEQRWANAKDDDTPPTPSTISTLSPASFAAPAAAPYLASVVQTVGNPDISGVPNTLWMAIQHALLGAKRYVYVEDQYLWSLDLAAALVDAAKHVKHITILVPDGLVGEKAYMRQRAIAEILRLGGAGIEKTIGIFQQKRGNHEWVHAKLFVVDDEYAIVGSANANNRGYFLDSEAAVGFAERAWNKPEGARAGAWFVTEANLARRMRMELWAEHLGLDVEELFDGVAARIHWEALPPTARVAPYQAINLKRLESLAGTEPERALWSEAPYADWDPGFHKDDIAVDPKS